MAAIRHILVAVDLTDHSPLALAKGMSLATSCRARLTIVHAAKAAADESHRLRLEARLSDLAGTEATVLLGARLAVLPGEPSRAIHDYARANDVDLIVVGRHVHGALQRFLFESAGDIVLRDAACSVLAVVERQRPSLARRRTTPRILCAVDFGGGSGATLAQAGELALQTRSPLAVLHVVEEWNWPEVRPTLGNDLGGAVPTLGGAMMRDATERLGTLVSAHVPPEVEVQTLVSFGVPALEIERLAADVDATLVVVGARSRRLLGHTFLGSTAHYLLEEPPCSVLLARPTPSGIQRLEAASEKELAVTE
jgi:nucleotide-binding universal stress UspA family protein